MKNILILSLCSMLAACSLSDSKKDDPAVRTDDLEFAVDTLEEPYSADPMMVEPEKITQTTIPDEEIPMIAPIEPSFEEFDKKATITGSFENYQVQKGDTLMLVAFKIYGDYRKWKDLREWNQDKIHAKLSHGMVLKYQLPNEKFGWMPSGLPYLVKTGDTLQVISMDKYGTTKKWKSIYENNRPLIRDANLIFAGFTLYYQPTRDLASEPR